MARTRRSTADEPEAKRSKTEDGDEPFQVGDALPDVELQLQSEEPVNLAKKYAKGLLVLYAYPKASTPGCTRQTSGFGSALADFEKLGAAVYGISADTPKAQAGFKEKTGVEFDLISDPEFELLEPLGAKKAPKSVVRSHFVFQDGKAVLVEHSVKPEESPKTTLAKVKELAGDSSEDADDGDAKDGDAKDGNAKNGGAKNGGAKKAKDEDDEEEAGDDEDDEEADADFAAEAEAQDDEEEEDGEYGSDEEAADAEEEENDADADEAGLKDEEVDEAEAQEVNEDESAKQEAEAEKDEDDGADAKEEE